ncbi:MAG: hypothetical protein ABIT83_20600 [Massilia sp.]
MSLLKLPSLLAAILGAGIFSAQAANMAEPPACARIDQPHQSAAQDEGSFSWSAQGDSVDIAPRAGYKIALWGDSLTSARNFVDAALGAYGIEPAKVAPSFIQAAIGVTGISLPLKASCASKGWRVAYAYKEKHAVPGFSKGMVRMSSDNPGELFVLDFRSPQPSTRVDQLNIVYEKARPDGSLLLAVSVDGGEERFISLSRSADTGLRIHPDAPMSTLRVRLVSGQITVHGFEPVYHDAPAVLLDTLSVPSGLLRSWSNTDPRYFPNGADGGGDYQLILVQYGTNEGASPNFDLNNYVDYLRTNLRRLRAFYPGGQCILIGPPDRGATGNGGWSGPLKFSYVHQQIAQAQKQVGLEYHCGFWDWQAAMGGPGTAAQWARMNPPHMQPDLTHLTAQGYDISGRLFAAAFPLNRH